MKTCKIEFDGSVWSVSLFKDSDLVAFKQFELLTCDGVDHSFIEALNYASAFISFGYVLKDTALPIGYPVLSLVRGVSVFC